MSARRTALLSAASALAAALWMTAAPAGAQSPARPHVPARTAPASSANANANVNAAPSAPREGVVNINTADEAALRRLPGVGAVRAGAIVALRQRVQRFRAPDDLLRVRGIGRTGLRRMRPYVTLTGDTTLLTRPGRPAPLATAVRAAPLAPEVP